MLTVNGDEVRQLAEEVLLVDIDVDQKSVEVRLIALDGGLGLKFPQAAKPQTKVENTGQSGEGSDEQPSNVPQVQTVMAHLYSVLLLRQIESPPMAESNSASIC